MLLMPFLMIITLTGSIALASDYAVFMLLAGLQTLVYVVAVLQIVIKPKRSHKIIQTLAYLVSGYTAGLIGSLRYLLGLERGRWKRIDQNN